MLCGLASLGFGRFSYGAILPFMKEGLAFDYSQTGLVASGIFMGYLVSAFLSGYVVIRFSFKKVIIVSMIIIASGMVLLASARGFWPAYIGSLLMGIGSGGSNIPALGVIARWFAPSRRGTAMGIVNSGNGLGMLISGMTVPLIITISPVAGWRYSWLLLASLILMIVIINLIFLKNDPGEVGMRPVGQEVSQPVKEADEPDQRKPGSGQVYQNKQVWMIGLVYMAWGFSYLIFSTFLVDYLIYDAEYDKTRAGNYFAVAGFVSIFSGMIWGNISDRIGRVLTMAIVYVFQGGLLLAIILSENHLLVLIEVILYGLSLFAVPTIANATVSEYVRPALVPVAMGFLTLFFGIGQFVSPIISGLLIDYSGNYFSTFILSASVLLVGAAANFGFHMAQARKRDRLPANHSA